MDVARFADDDRVKLLVVCERPTAPEARFSIPGRAALAGGGLLIWWQFRRWRPLWNVQRSAVGSVLAGVVEMLMVGCPSRGRGGRNGRSRCREGGL